MMLDKATIGIICLLGWCFFSALARVLTSGVTQYIDPVLLCFYTFSIATLFFIFCNLKNMKNILFKIHKHKMNVFCLNMLTFGAWFFLLYPLKYIEPAIVSTITLGLGPIATTMLGAMLYKKERVNTFDFFIAVVLFFVICYTLYLCFSGEVLLQHLNKNTLILAVGSCLVVGFATSAGNIYIKKMSDAHISPREILAIRFLLTVFASSLMLILKRDSLFISPQNFIDILIIANCLVILPLYLAQISIKLLDPVSVSIGASLMPCMVTLFEAIENKNHLSFSTVLSTVITALLILTGISVKFKKNNTL